MTERTAHDAGAIACPFVAFVDDREARADAPDHRHRCYAEIRPAPRAIAHQQAFCLSSGFAACPTFQDWARREAARARISSVAARPDERDDDPAVDEPTPAPDRRPALERAGDDDDGAADDDRGSDDDEPIDPDPDATPAPDALADPGAFADDDPFDGRGRNPHRAWSAPPPWVEPAARAAPSEPGAPGFLSSRGPRPDADEAAAAAGLSASRWLQEVPPPRTADGLPEREQDDELERALAEDRANRERAAALAGTVAATASSSRAAKRAAAKAPPAVSTSRPRQATRITAGPAWERPRRYEAYPTLKTRIGLPSLPRIVVAALALVLAAVILFALPSVLKLFGGSQGGGAAPTPTPTAGSSASVAPTATLAPTAKIYVIKSGDTLLRIAKRNGLTIDQLLAANKQIKDPNKIAVGDQITIPVAAPSEVINGASPGASSSP